jgi:cytochrome oxidase assembly protein ShyY1
MYGLSEQIQGFSSFVWGTEPPSLPRPPSANHHILLACVSNSIFILPRVHGFVDVSLVLIKETHYQYPVVFYGFSVALIGLLFCHQTT